MSCSLKINVNYVDSETGFSYKLPAVYTDQGILISHLRYLADNYNKSQSWKERSVFAIRLLLQFISASESGEKEEQATEILRQFSVALMHGTINYETLDDPSELFWPPRTITDTNNLIFHITNYTDYLSRLSGHESYRVNPFRKATSHEQRLNWCAYYHKKANIFLNHLKSDQSQNMSMYRRLIQGPAHLTIDIDQVHQFPENNFQKLIDMGFQNRGQLDYGSQAITMLLNYGGLRKSEIFHLFLSDIQPHPTRHGEALVRVYHPVYGSLTDSSFKNRQEYLTTATNYRPRNTYPLSNTLFSGWKGATITNKNNFFEVTFIPLEKAKEFLSVWVNYLKYQRVEPDKNDTHPFAFTNSCGRPETIKSFSRKHRRAVERIGLVSSKNLGTTEHGHRHAYGYRARKYGLSQIEIQKVMHHRNPNSCLTYIQPTIEDIQNQLRDL